MKKMVTLRFAQRRYSRESVKEIQIAYTDWEPSLMKWVWPALEDYERATGLQPVSITQWEHLGRALPLMEDVPSWATFSSIPIPEIELEQLRNFFVDLEDHLMNVLGASRGGIHSSSVRGFLINYLNSRRIDGKLSRIKTVFVSKARIQRKPRPLIGDEVRRDSDGVHAPVGAIRHENVKELKREVLTRLKDDLIKISDACEQEIEKHKHLCAVLRDIPNKWGWEHGRKLYEQLGLKCRGGKTVQKIFTGLSLVEKKSLVAYYIHLDSQEGASFRGLGLYPGAHHLQPLLAEVLGIEAEQFLRMIRYELYPRQIVLVSAIIQLQIATGWNVSSVMDLTPNNVKKLGQSQYLIQSVKGRSKDDTPQVLLEGGDNSGVKALEFVLIRLSELKKRGWASKESNCLWLSPRSNYDSSRDLPISNLLHGLKKLISNHGLPKFTFEQVRTQKLTIKSLEDGPIAAAEMAGHSGFSTIGGYIDHLVTRRLNSAVNLEFQRRWELEYQSTISYAGSDATALPIGDGASCKNINQAPDESWMNAGVCGAQNCHIDKGCKNRVLRINSDRIREVVLTRRYYESNWQRLYSENPEKFVNIHVPSLEFNFCLYEYLKKGPYRSLLDD